MCVSHASLGSICLIVINYWGSIVSAFSFISLIPPSLSLMRISPCVPRIGLRKSAIGREANKRGSDSKSEVFHGQRQVHFARSHRRYASIKHELRDAGDELG